MNLLRSIGLSASFSLLTGFAGGEEHEAIVIGSGFGGSIAAYNLGLEGVETLVLERGRWWGVEKPALDAGTFATLDTVLQGDGRSGWLSDTCMGSLYVSFFLDPIPCSVTTGVLEIIGPQSNARDFSPKVRAEGIAIAAGAGVGGGSLVYNGITYRPSKEAWDVAFPPADLPHMQKVWQELTRRGHFDEVLGVIDASPIPPDVLAADAYEGTRIMQQLALAAGYPVDDGSGPARLHSSAILNTATDWNAVRGELNGSRTKSVVLGEAWYGVNSGAKRSLDKSDHYLGMALQSGHVEVRALHTVTDISYDERRRLYIVDVVQTDEDYHELERSRFVTPHLFMSAGAVGTTKLMVRAKATGMLSRLNQYVGTRFSTNGNVSAFRFVKGGPVGQGGLAGVRVVNHDDPTTPVVLEHLPQRVPEFFAGIPELAPFLGAVYNLGVGIPSETGSFRYDAAHGEVVVNWPVDASSKVYNRFVHLMNELGGQPLILGQADATAFTAHPLGGMPLGLATDMDCQVKGYKNLYAVDGSLVPGAAAAANPSVLISALAQRCMSKVARQVADRCRSN